MSIEISTFKNQNYQNFNHTSKKSKDVVLEVSLVLNITQAKQFQDLKHESLKHSYCN